MLDHSGVSSRMCGFAMTALAGAVFVGAAAAASGTLYYGEAQAVLAEGTPIDVHSHAVTRLVDWDYDGDPDLLIGDGQGYVWLFTNGGSIGDASFDLGVKLQSGGVDIRAGTHFTTACFSDFTGDGQRDLAVAFSDRVRLYTNVGTRRSPRFDGYLDLEGAPGVRFLTPGADGRIDVADWNRDGLTDIWCGDFSGALTLFVNDGTLRSPHFAAGETFVTWPHNTHPTIADLNGDRRPDLVYGINWGYVGVYMNVGETAPELGRHFIFRFTDETELNIRALNNDDTTPTFADLDGDGILDLVSGGLNGKVWWMPGVSFSTMLAEASSVLSAHPADLGAALASDTVLRGRLFSLHWRMRDYLRGFYLDDAGRRPYFDWYAKHVTAFPQYFKRRHHDTAIEPYVPWLAAQVWVNLYELQQDSPRHRMEVANLAGFEGVVRDLLLDHAVLFMENSFSSAEQQRVVREYLDCLPPESWRVEVIQIGPFLGPGDGVHIEADSGVNIFHYDVGELVENSFPSDGPPGLVDVFSICLAHEISHNALDTVGRSRCYDLFVRKYELLAAAAAPDVLFQDPVTNGIDWTATQARFLSRGYWDGDPATWSSAWGSYWSSGPGRSLQEGWLRNNLDLCVGSPQEAFATLANQYFTNSRTMLELAKLRWDRGLRHPVNQFVLFADYYSLMGTRLPLVIIDSRGAITEDEATLGRDGSGCLRSITFGDGVGYAFAWGEDRMVSAFEGPLVVDTTTPSFGPALLRLGHAVPNPFFTTTRIRVELRRSGDVTVRVYDVAGRMVRMLAGATSAAGVVDLVWDGLSATGTPTAPGVYYYDLQEDGRTLTKQVLRLNR
jgi:hypothetical protein